MKIIPTFVRNFGVFVSVEEVKGERLGKGEVFINNLYKDIGKRVDRLIFFRF